MEYKEIVKVIKEIFNKSFKTAFNIEYNSRKEIIKTNPKSNIGEKAAAFYDTGTKKVYILSDVIEKIQSKNLNLNFDQGLTFLIHATFHELEHAIQKEHPEKLKNQFWYSKAMYDIESIILGLRGFDPQLFDLDYKKMHDNFLLEIDADIKGINNAKGFVKHYGIENINTEYYDLMDIYNKFRVNNYDIPMMINQFLRVVNKYPDMLSDERWLNNDELVSFFDKSGKIKSIEELKNIHSRFTKYIVASKEFLAQNNIKTMSPSQKMFVNDCIKRVIAEREEKDKNIKEFDIENVIKELKKYSLNPENSSMNSIPMASKIYYDRLREYSKLIENDVVSRQNNNLELGE